MEAPPLQSPVDILSKFGGFMVHFFFIGGSENPYVDAQIEGRIVNNCLRYEFDCPISFFSFTDEFGYFQSENQTLIEEFPLNDYKNALFGHYSNDLHIIK